MLSGPCNPDKSMRYCRKIIYVAEQEMHHVAKLRYGNVQDFTLFKAHNEVILLQR